VKRHGLASGIFVGCAGAATAVPNHVGREVRRILKKNNDPTSIPGSIPIPAYSYSAAYSDTMKERGLQEKYAWER
jgi:hypothetical protein